MQKITDQLIRHEGLRLTPYRCPAGRLTIGVGRNLEEKGISEQEAMVLLENDNKACLTPRNCKMKVLLADCKK